MCLVINQLEPKIADKDIICYKVVKRTEIKGVYLSEYQSFEYIIRRLYTNNINYAFASKVVKSIMKTPYINGGMFHSYASHLYPVILSPLPHCALLKCIIPKGAYYYKGYYKGLTSYASSLIKILEEV